MCCYEISAALGPWQQLGSSLAPLRRSQFLHNFCTIPSSENASTFPAVQFNNCFLPMSNALFYGTGGKCLTLLPICRISIFALCCLSLSVV